MTPLGTLQLYELYKLSLVYTFCDIKSILKEYLLLKEQKYVTLKTLKF